jgi:CheY-like chemotaxis protein
MEKAFPKLGVHSIRIPMILVVTVALTIVLFEVIPERSVWSIPEGIQEADEHIIAVPAYSGGFSSLPCMQRQCEKQHRHYKKKILIVDDESDVTIAFEKALRDKGFQQIYTANDPLLFLKNFKPSTYDLLLIDVVMQQIDGFRLYEEIRKIDNKVKVCFITAYGVNYQAMRAVFPVDTDDIGCFIQKPVNIGDLIKHIEAELL